VIIGLGLATLIAFALAGSAGVLIARVLDRNKKAPYVANFEPK